MRASPPRPDAAESGHGAVRGLHTALLRAFARKSPESAMELTASERALNLSAGQRFHRREWIVQRVGWGAMILVVVAAVLGLLGPGPLSRVSVGDEQSLLVEYQRFGRLETTDELRIRVAGAAASGDLRIWIDRQLLERGQILQIVPQPRQTRSEADRIVFEFDAAEEKPVVVRVSVRPDHPGRVSGRIGVEGGASVSLSQFTYP